MDSIEESTILAFVEAGQRDRLLALLSSAKRRKDATNLLNHFRGWDSRYAQTIASCADVAAVLVAAGAERECRPISDDPKLDGRGLPVAEAVEAAEMSSFASVLCCVPGKLAFFFDEVGAPRNRLLLKRP